MMTRTLVVFVTCPTLAAGQRLARTLVKAKLAACVNVLPHVESVFTWKGKTERARETLLIIKTPARRFEALRRAVVAHHPYEVPEVIALPIVAGHQAYLEWVAASC